MIIDSFRLDGKVALVTGSSRGLGQAAAVALAEAGADVALLDRSPAEETADQIHALGRRTHSRRAGPDRSHPAGNGRGDPGP